METVVKKVFIGLSSDIIKDTPVDTGRLRANWLPAINKFDNTVSIKFDKSGRGSIGKVKMKAQSYKLGDTVTLSNNVIYAKDIEFGLYPKSVKFGTPVKGHGQIKYEVRTIGGFSAKAPKGMVRLNLTRWKEWVDKEARKAR